VAVAALELVDDSVPLFTSAKELTDYATYRAAIGELIGTCLFVFMVTGCPVFSAGVSSVPLKLVQLHLWR
jgi:glycerol uptake facilitator-like aquaporin